MPIQTDVELLRLLTGWANLPLYHVEEWCHIFKHIRKLTEEKHHHNPDFQERLKDLKLQKLIEDKPFEHEDLFLK